MWGRRKPGRRGTPRACLQVPFQPPLLPQTDLRFLPSRSVTAVPGEGYVLWVHGRCEASDIPSLVLRQRGVGWLKLTQAGDERPASAGLFPGLFPGSVVLSGGSLLPLTLTTPVPAAPALPFALGSVSQNPSGSGCKEAPGPPGRHPRQLAPLGAPRAEPSVTRVTCSADVAGEVRAPPSDRAWSSCHGTHTGGDVTGLCPQTMGEAPHGHLLAGRRTGDVLRTCLGHGPSWAPGS